MVKLKGLVFKRGLFVDPNPVAQSALRAFTEASQSPQRVFQNLKAQSLPIIHKITAFLCALRGTSVFSVKLDFHRVAMRSFFIYISFSFPLWSFTKRSPTSFSSF